MKANSLTIALLTTIGLYAQQQNNGSSSLSSQAMTVMSISPRSINGYLPIGYNQFREADSTEFVPIDFQVQTDVQGKWLTCDFPPNRNINFIRILDAAGSIVGVYHRWDRMLSIGGFAPGWYQVQMVQFDNYAHTQSFYKR